MPTVEREHEEVRQGTVPAVRGDRVRWGPVWAGLVIALGTYLLLQLALLATGITDLADPGTGDGIATAIVAAIAFFVGGLAVGATAMWRGADDGLLNGVVMWAVALVALVALSAIGGGIALGSIDTTQVFEEVTSGDPAQALGDEAQETAAWALLGLGVALVASAIGGAVGARTWPSERRGGRVTMTRSEGGTRLREEQRPMASR